MCKQRLHNELEVQEYINYQTGEKLDLERVNSLSENAILKLRPELWCEYDFEKNNKLGLDIWKLTKGIVKKVWWLCENHLDKPYESYIGSRTTKNTNCPHCCRNPKVLKDFNDMWTTNPEQATLLANPEDGYKYMKSSNKKADWKCPDCETIIKNRLISNVSRVGLRCPVCVDYLSYPEKIMFNILKQLSVTFVYNSSFKWSDNKRYDFYIPSLNVIIETHGGQHYEGGFERKYGKTLEEEQVNDQYKYNLAIVNGIKPENYIEVDCRNSYFEFIRNSISNGRLAELFDLSNIDWELILKMSNNSFKKTIVNDWNSGIKNVKELTSRYSVHKSTIVSILKDYSNMGLCDYSPTNLLYQLNPNFEVIKIYKSTNEAILEYNELTPDRIRKSNKNRKLLLDSIWLLCRKHEFEVKLNKLKTGGSYVE